MKEKFSRSLTILILASIVVCNDRIVEIDCDGSGDPDECARQHAGGFYFVQTKVGVAKRKDPKEPSAIETPIATTGSNSISPQKLGSLLGLQRSTNNAKVATSAAAARLLAGFRRAGTEASSRLMNHIKGVGLFQASQMPISAPGMIVSIMVIGVICLCCFVVVFTGLLNKLLNKQYAPLNEDGGDHVKFDSPGSARKLSARSDGSQQDSVPLSKDLFNQSKEGLLLAIIGDLQGRPSDDELVSFAKCNNALEARLAVVELTIDKCSSNPHILLALPNGTPFAYCDLSTVDDKKRGITIHRTQMTDSWGGTQRGAVYATATLAQRGEQKVILKHGRTGAVLLECTTNQRGFVQIATEHGIVVARTLDEAGARTLPPRKVDETGQMSYRSNVSADFGSKAAGSSVSMMKKHSTFTQRPEMFISLEKGADVALVLCALACASKLRSSLMERSHSKAMVKGPSMATTMRKEKTMSIAYTKSQAG